MTSNSKHGTRKWIVKDTETWKTKTQKDKNLVFTCKQVQNADLYKPALKKNNDFTQIIHEIQFRSSFKAVTENNGVPRNTISTWPLELKTE